MAVSFESLSPHLLDNIQQEAEEWACCHGLVMRSKDTGQLTHAPFTLFPSAIPRALFSQAYGLAEDFNHLVHRITREPGWLLQALAHTTADPFTAALLAIYKEVLEEGPAQDVTLAIHRSDYMLHAGQAGTQLRQIEINTIAASFSNLSAITGNMHRYLLERFGLLPAGAELPSNATMEAVPDALAQAWRLCGDAGAVVVMVVHSPETNAFDQRWLQFQLWDRHRVPLVRCSLAELAERATLGPDRTLLLDGRAVAVVYFRAGYMPDDYPTQREWAARRMVERSRAVKCPSVAYQLAGTKKVQQAVAGQGQAERLVGEAAAARLRTCFAGLYSLAVEEVGEAAMADLLAKAAERPQVSCAWLTPQDYVLKPQREGGGNNLYDAELAAAVRGMPREELAAHILMERIRPPPVRTVVVRGGRRAVAECVGELGVFSVFVARGDVVHLSRPAGHLLRTKAASAADGGVAAGVAVLDSPLLL